MTDLPETVLAKSLARRPVLVAAAALALLPAAALLSRAALAQKEPDTGDLGAELAKPRDIPDLVLGKADAPVTIVEYASMTCGHCANFHNKVLPELKTKYLDTGKARLIMREFPLDNLAAAASMLARCAAEGTDNTKTFKLISELFEKQSDWAFVQGNPVPALFKIAGGFGFTKDSFDKCLTDQKLLDGITGTRDHANKLLKVRSTPTFFVNGKKLEGRSDEISSFDAAIEPLLAAPKAEAPAKGDAAKKGAPKK